MAGADPSSPSERAVEPGVPDGGGPVPDAPDVPDAADAADGPARPPLALRPLLAVLAVQALVLGWAAAGPGRYGYHRDELYFLAAGRRPAWGYPDQPPLTPWLARATELVHAHSPLALRVPAVLVALWVTALAAALAREFGGRAFAQLLAALAVGSGTYVLISGHLLSTSTTDLGVWVTLTWIVVRLLRSGDGRWWLAAGAVLGVGLLNKQLPVFLVAALAVGFALTPAARPALRSWWLVAGAAVALAAWAPVLVWQARHGWPQFTLAGQIRAEYGTPEERIGFAVAQLFLFSLGATVLWVTGLVRILRDPALARFRPLAWAWPVLMVLLAGTAGQVYYAGGSYPVLVAAGAVAAERWCGGGRRGRAGLRRALAVGGVVASAALTVPAALPVLSPASLDGSGWADAGEPLLESVGWPELVARLAEVRQGLPPDQRARAVVLTSNYGEAGAVEEYGPRYGLPRPAWSGHNGFGLWGPPPEGAGPVLLVWEGPDPSGRFTGCTFHGRVVTGVANEEGQAASIYVCSGPIGGWRAAWPSLVHLSA